MRKCLRTPDWIEFSGFLRRCLIGGTSGINMWLRVPDGLRTALRESLAASRIGTEIYYPLGVHQQECYRWLGYERGDLPETERAANEVMALPMFPELTAEQQKVVVGGIAAFFQNANRGHSLPAPKFLTHAHRKSADSKAQ